MGQAIAFFVGFRQSKREASLDLSLFDVEELVDALELEFDRRRDDAHLIGFFVGFFELDVGDRDAEVLLELVV